MKMRRPLREYPSPLVLCILFLAACGTLEVGVECIPTPEHAATAMVAALATENTHLAIQVATVAAPAPSTPIPSLVATYIDTEIGCALDYPAEWHIQATPGWLVVITSFNPASAPGIGGVPPDKAKVDLVPDKPSQSKSLEELVAEVYTQARNREVLEVLWEECWELAGNVPAVRMQIKGEAGGEMALLLTVINGRSLRLATATRAFSTPSPAHCDPFHRLGPRSPSPIATSGIRQMCYIFQSPVGQRRAPGDSAGPHYRHYQFRRLPGIHLPADRGE